ncbi:MAG: hypothetical protein HYZ29_25985 [Myxococcales bacterium]|nr:hypothetical protein [Myxococcales bacterium]
MKIFRTEVPRERLAPPVKAGPLATDGGRAGARRARHLLAGLALLVAGIGMFAHGQASGAFLLPVCPDFAWDAPGRCAWPYRFVTIGIALVCAAAAVLVRAGVKSLQSRRMR